MTLDPRLHAFREDLADSALRGTVMALRYTEGRPARVAVGLAPVQRAPDLEAPLDTFFHYGEAVRVFDKSGGYAWCESRRDSYVGYVDAAALDDSEPPSPTHYVATLGAYRYAEADLRSAVIDFLPRHAPVTVAQAGFECRGTRYVWLEDGGFMPVGCLSEAPPRSADLAAAAMRYLGCPYLWGGRSFLGIDCSGLVQEAFRDLGQTVPRDTDMQREAIGTAIDIAEIGNLRRNDLIYIPGHVMVAGGEGNVIHASGGDMSVCRDDLAELIRQWGYGVADLTVRRP